MEIEQFELPVHWAAALINDDTSGFEPEEEEALNRFIDWIVLEYGQAWCVSVGDDIYFSNIHDATSFGIGSCDCSVFSFDVTKR